MSMIEKMSCLRWGQYIRTETNITLQYQLGKSLKFNNVINNKKFFSFLVFFSSIFEYCIDPVNYCALRH